MSTCLIREARVTISLKHCDQHFETHAIQLQAIKGIFLLRGVCDGTLKPIAGLDAACVRTWIAWDDVCNPSNLHVHRTLFAAGIRFVKLIKTGFIQMHPDAQYQASFYIVKGQ